MKTFASLFTGFDGAGIGAQATGLTLAWGIEYRADIAEVANANLGGHVLVADILECDPRRFERVDVLHASPPCPNFSVAKKDRGETEHDLALAQKVADFVKTLLPTVFTLENVIAYRKSQSWRLIEDALWNAGYWLQVEYVNAADFGVPQTRQRMIVRAMRRGWVPHLPAPEPWRNWLDTIADLVDNLPDTELAPWQIKRLGEMPQVSSLFSEGIAKGAGGRDLPLISRSKDEPAYTVTANHNMLSMKALLINGGNPRVDNNWPSVRYDSQPTFTITGNQSKMPIRAYVLPGQIKAISTRCLARWQTIPDWYALPDGKRLAALGIGNAVPPLLYQRIAESLTR